MLILEETPVASRTDTVFSSLQGHYIPGTRICGVMPGKSGSQKILTTGFLSAGSPVISFDGSSMLFSAQQEMDGPWQIWEMDIGSGGFRKVISLNENCTDPVYLPDGRIVFSRMTPRDTLTSDHQLFSCNSDGSDLRQLTFSPSHNLSTIVLADGRLLTVSIQSYPERKEPMLMVLRPDGTKADLFYKVSGNRTLMSGATETSDGRILFIESEKSGSRKGRIMSVSYNRPLHSGIEITRDLEGDFCSVFPSSRGKLLVSDRENAGGNYSLSEFDPSVNSLVKLVDTDPEYDITKILITEVRNQPKKLPSEVDTNVKTGLLLCQDINFLNPFLADSTAGKARATQIEVLGADTTYGIVDVESDGSFQLKVLADMPFRIMTLDRNGNRVNGPGSWLWLRPNERRGCIGCHEDPEMVPGNKVSLAIWKTPVIIPVHINKVEEKTVELE